MSVEKESYAQHWNVLNAALSLLLSTPERCREVVSFQETYHSVYRCVHMGFAKQLYSDLLEKVSHFMNSWTSLLEQKKNDPADYLKMFNSTVKLYLDALKGIIPMFLYLNRIYLVGKLKLSLQAVLMDAFKEQFLSHHVAHVITLVDAFQGQPLSLDPSVSAGVVHQLYGLDNGYAAMNAGLFGKFIAPKPVGAPQHITDAVLRDVVETRSMEKQILDAFRDNRGDQGRKRGHPSDDTDV